MEDQKYVLITIDKIKYILNEKEKAGVFSAIQSGEKQIVIQGEMVPLHVTPAVILFSRWYAQELERLANSGKRLCKKCLKIMQIDDKCACWEEMGKAVKQDAFIAPPEQTSGLFSWPKLTEADKEQIKIEEAARRPIFNYTSNNEIDGYIDEEGIEHFE